MSDHQKRKASPSDLTAEQWDRLEPLLPPLAQWSPRERVERREIINGILYVLRTGCSWRQMPHDLPNGKTVYHYFRRWSLDGTWERAMTSLRRDVRARMGRDPEPSAALIESQSIKTSPVQGIERGFDAGKKTYGRKRHILVDTQGFLFAVKVHTAHLMDRLGAPLLLQQLTDRFPRLCHLFADSAYTGPLVDWIKATLGWETEIVPKADQEDPWVLINDEPVRLPKPKGGFQVQRHRWKIERTFGWFIRFRRLARDYEGLPQSSEAFIQIASLQLFLKRLTPFRPF